MHSISNGAALALGAATLGALACGGVAAQEEQRNYVSDDHVLSADLGPGGGSFTGVLGRESNRLCYILNVNKGDRPTAAHIHVGGKGESGRPVVPLATPASGSSGGCIALEAGVARALTANPGGHYVNVHSAAFPAGALRGQLSG